MGAVKSGKMHMSYRTQSCCESSFWNGLPAFSCRCIRCSRFLNSTKRADVQPVPQSFWFQNQQAKHCNEMLQDHRSWSKHRFCCLNGCKFQAEPATVCVILPWQSNSSLQDVEDPSAAVGILQRPVTAGREEGVFIFSGFTSVPLLIILVRLGLCNVCTLGLLGLADIVDMHQSQVDDPYDGLCTIYHNPARYGLSDPKLLACCPGKRNVPFIFKIEMQDTRKDKFTRTSKA